MLTSTTDPYPTDLDDAFTLSDQTTIRVRALHPLEEQPIRELFDHLSLRTRYFRFLSPLSVLPDSIVVLLTDVDYRRKVALVAEAGDADHPDVVALGSFAALDDEQVEVALVVRDDWQRRHIGTELALRILDAAEARGFHRFLTYITSENGPIRKLLRKVGDVVSATAAGGVSELVFVRRLSPPVSKHFTGCANTVTDLQNGNRN